MKENDNNNYEIIKGYFSVRRGEFLSSTDSEGKDIEEGTVLVAPNHFIFLVRSQECEKIGMELKSGKIYSLYGAEDFIAAGLYGYNSAMPANVPVICRIDDVSAEELLAAGYDAKTIKKCLSKNLPILKAKIAELEKYKMDNLRFYAQEKSSKQWRVT